MKLKNLIEILKTFDPESMVVNINAENNTVSPVEEIYQGSLVVTPKWSRNGQMIRDNGNMARNQAIKDFLEIKNTDVHLAICII